MSRVQLEKHSIYITSKYKTLYNALDTINRLRDASMGLADQDDILDDVTDLVINAELLAGYYNDIIDDEWHNDSMSDYDGTYIEAILECQKSLRLSSYPIKCNYKQFFEFDYYSCVLWDDDNEIIATFNPSVTEADIIKMIPDKYKEME